jgi:superfamily II DNA or RNA helicase
MRQKRLEQFDRSHYDKVIVDECHYSLADSFQRVLGYFNAKVLGITATFMRGDKRNLGEYYEAIAYEFPLRKAIRDGWLSKIVAKQCR